MKTSRLSKHIPLAAPAIAMALLSTCAALEAGQKDQKDVVLRAVSDEMHRSMKRLKMENLNQPYFISYTVMDMQRLELTSHFGALKDPQAYRIRQAKINLRVGSYEFDNFHYAGNDYWRYRPFGARLVQEDNYDALRSALWLLTDNTYKYALQKLAQKKAYKQARMIQENIPDLSQEAVKSSIEPPTAVPFERSAWEERLRRLSAIFRKYPDIHSSSVALYWTQRAVYFVDSEGRRIMKPEDDYEIVLEASAQAQDGHGLSDRRRFIRQSLQDMPPFPTLEAATLALAEDVSALCKAPLAENYIGPVLLEDQAAGEFFNQLLARNISSPRQIWTENEAVKEEFHAGKFASRLGLRAVSPLLNVEDDPGLQAFNGAPLIGHYQIDDEGIPARKVSLIEKGLLKDVLMSRSPIKERLKSNGHGRSDLMEFPTGRIGNLMIQAEKTLSAKELRQELLRQARDFGLKYGILIRRIAEEDQQEKDEFLAAPILAYKVFQDGREELVRNAQFAGVTLRALRDIVAASEKSHVYNYYQLGPYKNSRGQIQASIVHPSVLLAEMELKKSEKKPERLPYLKHPYFDR